jgi:tetratricopeptide (TPR) repeat protein
MLRYVLQRNLERFGESLSDGRRRIANVCLIILCCARWQSSEPRYLAPLDSTMETRALIAHYARQGYGRQLVELCDNTLKRAGASSAVSFWKAYGAAREGNFVQAVRECVALRSRRDSEYAALVALVYYHSSGKLVDRESLSSVQADTPAALERATLPSLVLAGTFAWLTGDARTARECADKALQENGAHEGALALRGWVCATAGQQIGIGAAGSMARLGAPPAGPSRRDCDGVQAGLSTFADLVLNCPPAQRDPDAVLGYAVALVRIGDTAGAVDVLGALGEAAPSFLPARTARAAVLMRTGDWQAAREAIAAVLADDAADIEGRRLDALLTLITEGPGKAAVTAVTALSTALLTREPRNSRLLAEVSHPLARSACCSAPVLAATLPIAEAAARLDPDSALYAVEVGFQRLASGDVAGSGAAYGDAARLDEANADAVVGMISVQLAAGDVADAEGQLEMFRMISETLGKGARVALLEGAVALRVHGSRAAQLSSIAEAAALHCRAVVEAMGSQASSEADAAVVSSRIAALSGGDAPALSVLCPPSVPDLHSWYGVVDGDLLLRCARAAVLRDGTASALHMDVTADSEGARTGLPLLALVSALLPGATQSLMLAARVAAAVGDVEGATRSVTRVLARQPSAMEAHMLLAGLELERGQPRSALAALERALSVSFAVQSSPAFLSIRAAALSALGKHAESLASVESALKTKGGLEAMDAADRAALLSLQVGMLAALGRLDEAHAAAVDAQSQLRGTPEEGSAVLAAARVMLARGDADAALAALFTVPPSSSAYPAVLEARADLYLHHRRDRGQYLRCFEEAVKRGRTPAALRGLGDAYCRMGYPDAGVRAFAAGLIDRPSDTALACRLASALLSMHDYRAGLACLHSLLRGDAPAAVAGALAAAAAYSAEGGGEDGRGPARDLLPAQAVLPPGSGGALDLGLIRSDLTELLVRLKRYDEAKEVMRAAFESAAAGGGGAADVVALRLARKNFLLLARVQWHAGDGEGALSSVTEAYGMALKALDMARRGGGASADGTTVSLEEERYAAACVTLELASVATSPERKRSALGDAVRHAEGLAGGGTPLTGSEAAACGIGAASFEGGTSPSLLEQATLCLARFHLTVGEEDECRSICTRLTSASGACAEAALLLADMQFRAGETTAAIFHYAAFLEAAPTAWTVLLRLAGLLRRAGKLAEVNRFLKAAVKAAPGAEEEAGYKLVRGALHRAAGEPAKAILSFNGARSSPAFALPAVEAMVAVYLSPDGDPLWVDRDGEAASESGDVAEAVSTATRLVDELPAGASGRDSVAAAVLRANITIVSSRATAGRSSGKALLEDAASRLAAVLANDPDHVPSLLALSSIFSILGDAGKARNSLKRLLKSPGADVYRDEAASAWLLLADLYSKGDKLEQAAESLTRALAVDMSCSRAHEALGVIAEREHK